MGALLNRSAKRDMACDQCGGRILKGDLLRVTRVRALTYRHACYAGTMYPKRYVCARCCYPTGTAEGLEG